LASNLANPNKAKAAAATKSAATPKKVRVSVFEM